MTTPATTTLRRARVSAVARYTGAVALLGVGIDHIEQFYLDSYRAIPTIGTLFALNFAAATAVAGGLVAPLDRIAGRSANRLLAVLALSGVAIALGSLGGLLASENGGLFGFTEVGYRAPVVASIVLEVAAAVLLAGFALALKPGARVRT